MTVNAAIYVRISSDARRDGLGVQRQRIDCTELAERNGWTVAGVFEDNDVSATKGTPRPEYERMMSEVDAGRIGAIVVWDVDRLTRTPRELEDVIDFADRYGLKLASVGGDIDLATEQGRMLARMKGTVARYEAEQSSRRLRRKNIELAAAGAHNGRRPYGWDLVRPEPDAPSRLIVNKAEAAVIREAAERILAGEKLHGVSLDLNRRGITTGTGGQWQGRTLKQMLLRWRNCGVRTHNGKEAGPGQWAPIYDRQTHERLVATLTDPARRTTRSTAVKYLLTGIALCGKCEKGLAGKEAFEAWMKRSPRGKRTEPYYTLRKHPRMYRCSNPPCRGITRPMAPIDDYVERVIVGVLERDGVRLLGGDPQAAEVARGQIEALEAKLALTADQFADDEITGDQMKRINDRIRPQLAQARDELRKAQPDEALAEFAGDRAAEAWAGAPVETKRAIITLLGPRITILPIGSGHGRGAAVEKYVSIDWG